jgi:adenylate kinase family enzyme
MTSLLFQEMKTVIIGNSGSGKTWLAQQLVTTGVHIVHLDHLFWKPGGFDEKRSQDEVDKLISESKTQDRWIVEGVFGELAERFLDTAKTLVWLDLSWDLCRSRLIQRGSESKRHLGRKQPEEGLQKLIEWASRYYERTDLRSHKGHQALLRGFKGVGVHLRSEDEVAEYAATPNKAFEATY